MLTGLTTINIELTSLCNKSCSMCGRRKLEKENPELCDWGDIDLNLAYKVLDQIPKGIIVQFHNNGEPLLYPYLKEVLEYRTDIIKCLNTNGKLLSRSNIREIVKKYLNTLTISIIENDIEGDKQISTAFEFFMNKDFQSPPLIIFRMLGNINKERKEKWEILAKVHNCIIATRVLHSPKGSFDYQKKVTIPEVGFCMDLFSHLVIDRYGDVYPCVRFNHMKYNKLGNVKEMTLDEMWNGNIRLKLLDEHIKGNRKCSKLCETCHYWGIPRGE